MNERKSFKTEAEAVNYAKAIAEQLKKTGAPQQISKEKLVMANAYLTLLDKLKLYGKTPEDAVEHYLTHLGNEILNQALPSIYDLADKWRGFKREDTKLTKKTLNEIDQYWRFIKRTWGRLKPDVPKKNDIDLTLKRLKVENNTRRKYLKYVRQFFAWVIDEGHIDKNPTNGLFYKPDDFNAEFYDLETTKKLLHYVAQKEKDLVGFYALLTFVGLRPTEGERVQWKDYNSKTHQLYVRKGKTRGRYVTLEPVAIAWMEWHREQTPQTEPFVKLKALPNRQKQIRAAVLEGRWIQDGLRHGFATFFRNLKQDIALVADYMGNSPDMIKRHYARAIDVTTLQEFWALTPEKVLENPKSQGAAQNPQDAPPIPNVTQQK